MPIFAYSTAGDGFAVEALIDLPSRVKAKRRSYGLPIPPAQFVRALVDSGSDASAVAPRLVRHFGFRPVRKVEVTTAAGSHEAALYNVALAILGSEGGHGPLFMLTPHLATGLSRDLPNCELLIGRNALAECLFLADGPGKRFTLAF